MAVSLGWGATGDDFEFEIVMAGTTDQHEIQLPAPGGVVDLEVLFSSRIEGVQGWSLGVVLETAAGVTASITALRQGRNLETVNYGGQLDFEALRWYAAGDLATIQGSCSIEDGPCQDINAGAFAQGITVPLWCIKTIRLYRDVVAVSFRVHVDGPPGGEVCAQFSDTVGKPAIATVAIHGGLSYPPPCGPRQPLPSPSRSGSSAAMPTVMAALTSQTPSGTLRSCSATAQRPRALTPQMPMTTASAPLATRSICCTTCSEVGLSRRCHSRSVGWMRRTTSWGAWCMKGVSSRIPESPEERT